MLKNRLPSTEWPKALSINLYFILAEKRIFNYSADHSSLTTAAGFCNRTEQHGTTAALLIFSGPSATQTSSQQHFTIHILDITGPEMVCVNVKLFLDGPHRVLVGKQNESTNSFFISCHASIDEILRTFWEVQTLPQRRLPTEEELQRREYVKRIFQETTIVGNHLVEIDAPDKDFHRLPWRRKKHQVK